MIMHATIKRTLDTVRLNRQAPLYAALGDYGARMIQAIITVDGVPYAVPSSASVTVNAKRSDGKEDRFLGNVNEDGSVIVPITQWMLLQRGDVECTISAISPSEKLTTTPFILIVTYTPQGDDISEDDPEYDLLAQVLAGEAERVAAENTRVAAEQQRLQDEEKRIADEQQRTENEAQRVSNEASRVNAEKNRADTFAGWVGDMGQLGNFNARLTNVESAIYGDLAQKVVDDSVAHTKDVPAAAKPYARVDMIGGMTRKCTQLIPFPYADGGAGKTKTMNGVTFIVNADGSITVNGTPTASAYFNLSKGIAWATSNVTADNGASAFGGKTFSNCRYNAGNTTLSINVAVGTAYENYTVYPMINAGDTAQPYEPYFEGLRSAKVESVESVGVNLFDGDEVINVDGYKQIKLPKPLPPGTYYVSAMVSSTDTDTASTRLAFVSGSNNYYVIFYRQAKIETKTITIPTTVTSVRLLSGYSTDASEGDTSVWTKLQIERNGFTDYKPYQAHTLPIPAEVREKPWYGLGISKDVCNAIRYNEDGSRSGDVKCEKIILSGTELWSKSGNVFSTDISKQAVRTTLNLMSHGYNFAIASWQELTDKQVQIVNQRFGICDTSFGTVGEWAAFLSAQYAAGNPLTVVYALADPVTEDISDILPADNYIGVEGGGTLTFVNEYGYDVPSEVVFVTKEVTE